MAPAVKNILLKIAYDGSGFHGWARQPGLRTVQGVLEETLGTLLGAPVSLEGTSRTDAGVHALSQYATLRGDFHIPAGRIPPAANNRLSDACILSAEEKPKGFHARFSAIGKKYLYRFAIAPETQKAAVFLRNYAYLLAKRPNVDNMVEAAGKIVGTHDFASFQAAGGALRETTVRTVFGINIKETACYEPSGSSYEAIEAEVTGNGFLYRMVRIIAGTLLDVGFGKLSPNDIDGIIASKDRAGAGQTAPPQGLYLKEVFFNNEHL